MTDASPAQPGADDSLGALLAWERGVLRAASVPHLLEAARARLAPGEPGPVGAVRVATLLIADPGHEMRHLLLGERTTAVPGLSFCDSLTGIAPQFAALHEPWLGAFSAADHALLFPGEHGLRRVVLIPLLSRRALVGAVNIGCGDEPIGFDACGRDALAQVADVINAAVERLLDHARLRRGGLVDPMTGWHTKRYLQARLSEEIARCQRHGGFVACALIGIDGLQSVNEELGPLAGDHALREIAARIEGQLRASDTSAQLDADEFAVVLSNSSARLAVPLADRIVETVRAEPVALGAGRTLTMSVSVGVAAVAARPGAELKSLSEQLLAKARVALCQAKLDGRDRCSVDPD